MSQQLFNKTIIAEVTNTIQCISKIATTKKFKNWETTVEKCSGLHNALIRKGSLSQGQCEIIYNGCKLNSIPCPDVISAIVNNEVKRDPREELFGPEETKKVQITLDQEDLDALLTHLALMLSKNIYESLSANND